MVLRALRLIVLLVVIGLVAAVIVARTQENGVTVNVREGAPTVADGKNALVILRSDLVEQLVRDALSNADLPFEVNEVDAAFRPTGIAVSGRVQVNVLDVQFSAVAHPVASDDGTVAVRLTDLRAQRSQLPSAFELAIEHVINQRLTTATQIKDFRVKEVEVGNQELLVYLEYAP